MRPNALYWIRLTAHTHACIHRFKLQQNRSVVAGGGGVAVLNLPEIVVIVDAAVVVLVVVALFESPRPIVMRHDLPPRSHARFAL